MKTEEEIRRQLNGLIFSKNSMAAKDDIIKARIESGIHELKWVLGEM